MEFYVNRISGKIPHIDHSIDIEVGKHNLVITGQNGSGKTSFLEATFQSIKNDIQGNRQDQIAHLENKISSQKNIQSRFDSGHPNYIQAESAIRRFKQQLADISEQMDLEIAHGGSFRNRVASGTAVIRHFPAARLSKIIAAQGAGNEANKPHATDTDADFGAFLEQYLVNLRTRRSFAITDDKNQEYADSIAAWFEEFTDQLRYLFEEESTELKFDSSTFKYKIHQNGKEPFTFQNLSAGYTALLAIFSDLLLRSELNELPPNKLAGIVLIDEIDAHLHVSIQRKVLKFLTDVFPNIQFIVTTHSPFVLSSVDNAIIYDLTRGDEVGPDLSMYSYNTIVEGILGVPPSSQLLKDKIVLLMKELEKSERDIERISSYIAQLAPQIENMDVESRSVYEEARKIVFLAKKNLVTE